MKDLSCGRKYKYSVCVCARQHLKLQLIESQKQLIFLALSLKKKICYLQNHSEFTL